MKIQFQTLFEIAMWLKYPIITALFLIGALLQASFLPHFNIAGIGPNLVFIFFFILIFFQSRDEYYKGIFLVIVAGFLLDIFSLFPFGLSIILLLGLYLLMKVMVYFLQERQEAYSLAYFLPVFLLFLIAYQVFFYIGYYFPNPIFPDYYHALIILWYNTIFAVIGFYIYPLEKPKQLKLF